MLLLINMKLIRPSIDLEDDIIDFKEEFLSNNEKTINGGELLDSNLSFSQWLSHVSNNSSKDSLPPDWVLTDTYLAIESDTIVGIICLRHYLNDFLSNYGHIAFSVRPTKRKKRYATLMLGMILDKARNLNMTSVQLSAMRDNVASTKTIIKNGGVYTRSFNHEGRTADVYIIDLLHQ